ncbi:MAG: hypothetical protein ACBR12_08725 [Microcoleus sp.]
MTKFALSNLKIFSASIVAIAIANPATAASFSLNANTSDVNKLDLGFFTGETILDIKLSGTISLGGLSKFYADGSLATLFIDGTYPYAIAGASGYPTSFGGDGINHFVQGGLNYDTMALASFNPFGIAGKETTDTTDINAIRFASVVGTFTNTPTRNDWFFIGLGRRLAVPEDGANLYLAVNDTYYPNDEGAYSGRIEIVPNSEPVPEPTTVLGSLAFGAVVSSWRMKRKQQQKVLNSTIG